MISLQSRKTKNKQEAELKQGLAYLLDYLMISQSSDKRKKMDGWMESLTYIAKYFSVNQLIVQLYYGLCKCNPIWDFNLR